jgi:hypothetical protein
MDEELIFGLLYQFSPQLSPPFRPPRSPLFSASRTILRVDVNNIDHLVIAEDLGTQRQ